MHLSYGLMAHIKAIRAIKMISLFGRVLKTIVLKSVADDLLMAFTPVFLLSSDVLFVPSRKNREGIK